MDKLQLDLTVDEAARTATARLRGQDLDTSITVPIVRTAQSAAVCAACTIAATAHWLGKEMVSSPITLETIARYFPRNTKEASR